MLKNILIIINNKWCYLLLIILTLLLEYISLCTNSNFLLETTGVIIIIISLFTLLSILHSLILKQWKDTIIRFVKFLFVCFLFLLYIVTVFWSTQIHPDHFADDLIIPDNIVINIPQDIYNIEREKKDKFNTDFDIYTSFQPGLYDYDFWTSKIEKGIIYLKAFEVTHEYRLSENQLIETTSIPVYNPVDSIIRFGTTKHFTIYEGDWGKPYATRFELWYKPDDGDKERKLSEKIYKIEGW